MMNKESILAKIRMQQVWVDSSTAFRDLAKQLAFHNPSNASSITAAGRLHLTHIYG